jgi:hypothetical protein
MQSAKERPILQVGDFVKVQSELGEEFIVSVKERIGSYVVLSNGIRFHILDDRRKSKEQWWKSKEQWIDECTRSVVSTIAAE